MNDIKLADEFVQKLKIKSNIFNNFGPIFEKATNDGYLHCAHLTLNNIFKQEVRFAIEGNLTRSN